MKSIISVFVRILLISIMVTGLTIHLMNSVSTYAIEVKGNCDLIVIPDEEYVPTDNLNPGDSKTSYLTLINNGEETTSVYLNTDIILSMLGLDDDKSLIEKIQITISNEDGFFYTGNIGDLRDNPLFIGDIKPKEDIRLSFTINFDYTTENEYQGLSLSVKWIFTTVCGDIKGIFDSLFPKTGDSSSVYYIIGIGLIIIGFIINKKNTSKVVSNMKGKAE